MNYSEALSSMVNISFGITLLMILKIVFVIMEEFLFDNALFKSNPSMALELQIQ